MKDGTFDGTTLPVTALVGALGLKGGWRDESFHSIVTAAVSWRGARRVSLVKFTEQPSVAGDTVSLRECAWLPRERYVDVFL